MSNIGTKFILAKRFVFDPNSNSLMDQAEECETVRLGSNESRILLLLCEKPNEVITRNQLHEFVWRDQGFEVDDSSLTQAISTLRKMLKDSTKSPAFVKTVPKRGYQLIANVERSAPLASSDTVLPIPNETTVEESSTNVESEPPAPIVEVEVQQSNLGTVTQETASFDSKLLSWLPKILVSIAILLPLLVLLFTNPAESQFRQLAVVDNIPIKTPLNHPDISKWVPSIKTCIESYNERHRDELMPSEVIATGGENNRLVLNYIHPVEFSGENVTLRIFTELSNLNKVCK